MLLPLLMNLDFAAGNIVTPPTPSVPNQSGDGVRRHEESYHDKEQKENEERIEKQIKDEDELFEMILQGFLKMMN